MEGIWFIFQCILQRIILKEDDKEYEVYDIVPSTEMDYVKVIFVDRSSRLMQLSKYRKHNEDPLSNITSRKLFIEKWKETKCGNLYAMSVEPEVNNARNNKDVDTSVQRSDFHSDKLVYDFILVHTDNLCEPNDDMKFRQIDERHCDAIRDSMMQNNNLKCHIMLGNSLLSKEELLAKDLKKPGAAKIEVIGGNHTRRALQNITAMPEYGSSEEFLLWPVKLYSRLNRLEAQKLGYDHNVDNEYVKPTTAFELLQFFRREAEATSTDVNKMSPAELKTWKENICHVLGCSKEELHNRHKTLVQLARSPVDIWRQLKIFEGKWYGNSIKAQPKGMLKTGHLKVVSTVKETDQELLLKQLNSGRYSWPEFKTACSQKVKSYKDSNVESTDEASKNDRVKECYIDAVNIESTEDNSEQHGECENDTDADQGNHEQYNKPDNDENILQIAGNKTDLLRETKSKLSKALATIETMGKTEDSLKKQLQYLSRENERLRTNMKSQEREINDLNTKVQLLKVEKVNLEEDLKYYMFKNVENGENEMEQPPAKRLRIDDSSLFENETANESCEEETAGSSMETDNQTIKINDRVQAFWKQNETWYDATVIRVNKSSYRVEFLDDDIKETLPERYVRKI